MKLTAFTATRPTTNLMPDSKYQLTKAQNKEGFMGVFKWAYSGDPRKTMLKIVLGALGDASNISLRKDPRATSQEERRSRAIKQKALREYEETRSKMHLAQYTRLQKINGAQPFFKLSLPIVHFSSAASLSLVTSVFGTTSATNEVLDTLQDIMKGGASRTIDKMFSLRNAHLSEEVTRIFSQTMTGVTYRVSGTTGAIAFIDFKISQLEAESLVSTDWMEIRPVDLYPLFVMWVEAEYESKSYGKSAISLSKIANTLPAHSVEDRRTDEHGIAIDMSGQPVYLPVECNNTARYEGLYASVGTRPDTNDFTLIDIEEDPTPPSLPSNIPILVDWVNYKFTYSNSAGRPVIMPLENMRKCNSSMAVNILKRPVMAKFMERLARYAQICNVSTSVTIKRTVDAADYDNAVRITRGRDTLSVVDYFNAIQADDKEIEYKYHDLVDGSNYLFEPIRKFIMSLVPAMQNNVDALYQNYAVSTTVEALGLLSVMFYYGTVFGETQAAANQKNKAAQQQGIDPTWTPPAIPLVTEKFSKEDAGLLPHQAKIRNILRESPDFAILPVDAGGGKSMLAITDVLYEIKEHRSAPYLIMCPAHLVANYVSEIVEFTDGKVNVIPVTSFNIRTSGYKRYQQILETAPINTILVVDYNVLKYRARAAVYGTAAVAIFPVVDMIRQFRPGYCLLDESHMLKNAKSATFKSVMNLIADIPKKRIATGTLNPDSPSDLPAQVAIMDPTIFGTREDFNEKYSTAMSGQRVTQWRSSGKNSVGSAMAELKQNIVWAPAKRKEWACALPPRKDRFIAIELTENQRDVYDAIFNDMVAQIKKAAESDKNAKKLLDNLMGKKASAADEDDFGDMGEDSSEDSSEDILDDSDDIGASLQPYLVDIERFITNPGFHPYAKNGYVAEDGKRVAPLTGDDLMPPKARVLKQLMLDDYDLFNKTKGKVLVFVNYTESAQAIYNAMPPEIQACGILYSTASKTELVNKFKTDPNIRWMVGIRKSLEVGLNLQIASALVRLEGVWTPGEQEQGDSRIARPYFGPGGDQRPLLRFDTIVANRTLDITKAARLRAKMVALAKFENSGDPAYEALDDIPLIPMKLEAIQTMNDFETNLARYQSTMEHLNVITKEEYAEYRRKIEAEGGFKFTQVQQAKTPEGCAILARVPYAQGTELYNASELGLVRVDNFLGLELSGDNDDEDTEAEDADDNSDNDDGSNNDEARKLLMGMACHTEYGEGVIVGMAFKGNIARRINVRLNDGTTARGLRSTNVFVITRTETNGIDMRNKLARAAGMDVTADITVPGVNIKQTKITLKEQREEERRREREIAERQKKTLFDNKKSKISVALQLNIINGYLQVGFIPGTNQKAATVMEALGFKQNPSYYYTRIRTFRHLITQAQNWADAGFHVGDQYDSGALAALSVALTQNGLQSHRHYAQLMTSAQFRNYMRNTFKPTADKKLLNLFALVTDGGWADPLNLRRAGKKADEGDEAPPAYGISYLCMPAGGGHPGSRQAIMSKYLAPGTKWRLSEPTLTRFVGSIQGVQLLLDEMKAAGVTVNNIEQLNKYARSVKKVAPKVDDTVFDPKEEAVEEKPVRKSRKEVVEPVKKTRRNLVKEVTPVRKTRR